MLRGDLAWRGAVAAFVHRRLLAGDRQGVAKGGIRQPTLTAASIGTSPMLSWVLESLAGQPQASLAVGGRVMIGNGLPAIPKKMVNKIRNWEYVELAELPPHDGRSRG